jgi:hypothetical protein
LKSGKAGREGRRIWEIWLAVCTFGGDGEEGGTGGGGKTKYWIHSMMIRCPTRLVHLMTAAIFSAVHV